VFFVLSKTLDHAFSPLSWAIALVALSVALARRRPVASRRCGLAALVVLVVFSLEPVSNGLVRALEARAPTTAREDVTYDAVILLAGFVEERPTEDHGQRSYSDSIERLTVTFDLLRAGRARLAIVSGGPPNQQAPVIEARVLADQLVAWGIARERVIVEPTALNTRDNAVESARIARTMGLERLVVVTSAFHMPRSLACFRAVGLAVDALPVDWRGFDPARHGSAWLPRVGHLTQSSMALRELAGSVVYRVVGYAR
jgi:uncharacterized SAM-binding protein YcdF (DUF218 family)